MAQRVLVLDDDIGVGKLVKEAAVAKGIHCDVTTDLDAFIAALTADTTLIFLDLVMPKTDGIEVLRRLSVQRCDARIVLMSGIGRRVIETASALGNSLDLSMAGHLAKPFRMSEVETLLETQVDAKRNPSRVPSPRVNFDNSDLIRAVELDELVLHYQPQIELSTGRVIGVEGLVRWVHREQNLIYPDHFIGMVEKLGLMEEMTNLVFHHGLSVIGLFCKVAASPLNLSLNISASSLGDISFPDRFIKIVQEYDFTPDQMILEITETGLINELSRALDVLTRLRMKKVMLSIDDFGTGFSMMNQLRNTPATEIKIDRSLVQNLDCHNDRIMLHKTVELGHELGMKVVAEGVETKKQLNCLEKIGCDVVQGYFFSRPLSTEKLFPWLELYKTGCSW